ncbi:P-loop containing nucleoside triphosphate hydrolase protein [Lyophyllum atratum]|nr:P-loop containing nucleoside triphosphate hydrolase protein [Lyophyllum atratum]
MSGARMLSSQSRSVLRIARIQRHYTTSRASPIIHVPKSNVYHFGDPNTAPPVFRDLEWTVREDESWAVIGSGSSEKASLFQTLLGHLRISPAPPPPGGLFPFLSTHGRDPYTSIALVSFGNRRRAAGGAFYDFSARYGAVRDEDRVTLRQSMFPETIPPKFPELELDVKEMLEGDKQVFQALVDRMGLQDLLDLPLIALSNGQTRRARIIKAILGKPELLLLDEPLTGLDVQNRPKLLEVLRALHSARAPRVILGLRTQDPVPEWITHVALVKGGKVATGPKDAVLPALEHRDTEVGGDAAMTSLVGQARGEGQGRGELLVDMQGVNVRYGPRTILNNITWQIREGERWHLQGTNGSGKTTLLSLLTGSHPQSYTNPHLHLFNLPRARHPTPHLQSLIGLLSPELFDAFPRRADMSVREAVGTGFDGGYVAMGREGVGVGVMRPLGGEEVGWRVGRVGEVLEALGPRSWGEEGPGESAESFGSRSFPSLSPGAQRMVLLMRALVGRPPLVLLDEAWSGMGEGMVRAARRYLREGGVGQGQGVVVVTHWEGEVPWGGGEGVMRFRLDGGVGGVVDQGLGIVVRLL